MMRPASCPIANLPAAQLRRAWSWACTVSCTAVRVDSPYCGGRIVLRPKHHRARRVKYLYDLAIAPATSTISRRATPPAWQWSLMITPKKPACLPCSYMLAAEKAYLHMYRFGGKPMARQRAMPHIKSYGRYHHTPGVGTRLAWFCLASHNLSKAAWGLCQKGGAFQILNPNTDLWICFMQAAWVRGKLARMSEESAMYIRKRLLLDKFSWRQHS